MASGVGPKLGIGQAVRTLYACQQLGPDRARVTSRARESSRQAKPLTDEVRTRPFVVSRVPVLAALVADLVAQGLRPSATARPLRLTDSYVAKLHRITRDVPADVLRDWRTVRRPLSVDAMLSVAASADPSGRYRELQASLLDRRGYQATLRRAREYGRMFARLDMLGFRAPNPPYNECIACVFPRLDPKYWAEAAAAAERGWEGGVASCNDEYDDDDDG